MIPAVHQYTPDITPGDGVSNSLFFIQNLLQEMGYPSRIFADTIHPQLKEKVQPRTAYPDTGNSLVLIHHAVAQPHPEWILGLKDIRAMVYHNITPSLYFEPGSVHERATLKGREQLGQWQHLFRGVIADSTYNAAELCALGYDNIHEIPLVVDMETFRAGPDDPTLPSAHDQTFNLLFVGRIAENKCQHDLIQALAEIRDTTVHLFCVGGVTSPSYQAYLSTLVRALGLDSRVHFTGRVSDAELRGYYRAADLFVCLSDHEGFGIPLIEAAAAGLPAVAYDSSNIRHTLAGTGVLLDRKHPRDTARIWARLIDNPLWRYRLAAAQQAGLDRFSRTRQKQMLNAFITSLVPSPSPWQAVDAPPGGWVPDSRRLSIEGPFDSNYSLALVNRELARAMTRAGLTVELHATEGGGDYHPDLPFLDTVPDVKKMWNQGSPGPVAGFAVRNLYPPRVTGMNGARTILGPYGWEESAFPENWIKEFNRRLLLVAAMSEYVSRTLVNNGLTVPIAVTGIGADHLKDVAPAPLPFDLPRGFTLLHISSCFPRKGVDLVLAAFDRALPPDRPAALIIKTFANPHNDVRDQLAREGWRLELGPYGYARQNDQKKIFLVEDELTPGQMVSLYTRSHVLAAPSRGEGFGLPMAEAMLFGLPVITTGYGGQTDFCTRDTAWLIDYEFARADTHMHLSDSVWAEPDLTDFVEKILEVAALPRDEIRSKTDRARAHILAHHTWDRAADRMRTAARGLDRLPAPRPARTLGWVTTWNTACGIASYSKYLVNALCAVRPDTARTLILANHGAPTTAPDGPEVIRCWASGCQDDLAGLIRTVRAQNIRDLVIQFNFSFFNLQALAHLLDTLGRSQVNCHLFFHSTADVAPPHVPKSLSWIRDALAGATRLYVHSVPDLNILKRHGLTENVTLFPHGITLPLGLPLPQEQDRIAAFGFLLPHKGIMELIAAFDILKKDRPGACLLLLNALYPAPASRLEQARCMARIQASPWAQDITMINDYLSDREILEQLSSARIIVFPCQETQESSSASVRAGLAAGRPVAVTPLDIFDDVSEAVLTLPGTRPEEMARGLLSAMADQARLEKTVARQQAFIREHDWNRLGNRLHLILTGLGSSPP